VKGEFVFPQPTGEPWKDVLGLVQFYKKMAAQQK